MPHIRVYMFSSILTSTRLSYRHFAKASCKGLPVGHFKCEYVALQLQVLSTVTPVQCMLVLVLGGLSAAVNTDNNPVQEPFLQVTFAMKCELQRDIEPASISK